MIVEVVLTVHLSYCFRHCQPLALMKQPPPEPGYAGGGDRAA